MILRRLLPIVIIAAGLGVVAFLADGWVTRDRDARLADDARALAAEAEALGRRWKEILGRSVASARSGGWDGLRLLLTDSGEVRPFSWAPPPEGEERDRVDRACAVGDRLEAEGEVLRAVDAYTFSLGEVVDPRLRDRLLLHAGRAALSDDATRAWGIGALRSLGPRPSRGRILDVPIDLLARLAMPPGSEFGPPITATDLLARADELSPAALTSLARRFRSSDGWTDDPRLDRAISQRSRAAQLIARETVRLATGLPTLTDRILLIPLAQAGARASNPIAVIDMAERLPVPPSDRLRCTVLGGTDSGLGEAGTSGATGEITAVAHVLVAGESMATLLLEDLDASGRRRAIVRRAATLRWVLLGALFVVGGALLATWIALDRQRRLAALKVRLLANVSHELKTPVTSIRIFGELLGDPSVPRERVAEFAGRITRESQRLGRRIEEILETAWSRESGRPLESAAVDLRSVVDEVVGRFRDRSAEQGATIVLTETTPSPEIETNRDALERIVENLIDNALKYGRPSSGDGPRIAVAVGGEAGTVRVVVEDDGPGIPPAEADRVFAPFYRAAYEDYAVPGTGLGLSISRSFAERLGGSLRYAPSEGHGSCFTLTLPCRAGPRWEDRAVAKGAPRQGRESHE